METMPKTGVLEDGWTRLLITYPSGDNTYLVAPQDNSKKWEKGVYGLWKYEGYTFLLTTDAICDNKAWYAEYQKKPALMFTTGESPANTLFIRYEENIGQYWGTTWISAPAYRMALSKTVNGKETRGKYLDSYINDGNHKGLTLTDDPAEVVWSVGGYNNAYCIREYRSGVAEFGVIWEQTANQLWGMQSAIDKRWGDYFYNPYYMVGEGTGTAYDNGITVTANQSMVLGQPIDLLPEGKTLTVKSGAVVSITGTLLNDGQIIVEPGGLLILKEGSCIMPYSTGNIKCGGITNNGNIVVMENAKLIGGGVNGLVLSSGHVINFGLIASGVFRASAPYVLENRAGAKVFANLSSLELEKKNSVLLDCVAHTMNNPTSSFSLTNFVTGYADFINAISRSGLMKDPQMVKVVDNWIYGPGQSQGIY